MFRDHDESMTLTSKVRVSCSLEGPGTGDVPRSYSDTTGNTVTAGLLDVYRRYTVCGRVDTSAVVQDEVLVVQESSRDPKLFVM